MQAQTEKTESEIIMEKIDKLDKSFLYCYLDTKRFLTPEHSEKAEEIITKNIIKKNCSKCYGRGYLGWTQEKEIEYYLLPVPLQNSTFCFKDEYGIIHIKKVASTLPYKIVFFTDKTFLNLPLNKRLNENGEIKEIITWRWIFYDNIIYTHSRSFFVNYEEEFKNYFK